MRILFITPIFLPKLDGTVRLIHNLARGLVLKNHSITILTRLMKNTPAHETVEGIDVVRVPPVGSSLADRLKFIGNASAFLEGRFLNGVEFDVVHAFGSSALMAAIVATFRRVPIIATFPGVAEEILVGGDSNKALKFVGLAVLRLTSLPARHLTVPTSNAAHGIIRNIGRLNQSKLIVIPNPLNIRLFFSERTSDNAELEHAWEIGSFYPEILSVGNLSYRKGFDILLRAFREAMPNLKNARLTIVGKGPRFKELNMLVRELQLVDRVRFLSGVDDNQLARLYRCCDMFVSTSRPGGEAFGYAIVEAMAACKPVISTLTPGPKEIVENSGGGLLVETGNVKAFADAIVRLSFNTQLAQSMACSGHKFVVENFDLDVVVSKFEKLYSS